MTARFRGQARELVREERLLAPASTVRIVPLDGAEGDRLRAGGRSLQAARLLPESGTLTALGCVAATIGPALEHRVRALFGERKISLALALDDLGNELLMDVSRRAGDKLAAAAEKRRLSVAGELRPGDPGMPLSDQSALLELAHAASIGVAVSPGGALVPLKSSSAVYGVGAGLPAVRWSRCDDCPSKPRCKRARAAAEATRT